MKKIFLLTLIWLLCLSTLSATMQNACTRTANSSTSSMPTSAPCLHAHPSSDVSADGNNTGLKKQTCFSAHENLACQMGALPSDPSVLRRDPVLLPSLQTGIVCQGGDPWLTQVPFYNQLQVNWCGLAGAQMVMQYWGFGHESITQQELAWIDDFNGVPNGLRLHEVESIFDHYSYQFHWSGSMKKISESHTGYVDDIKECVNAGLPVIVFQRTTIGATQYHYRVVVGFDEVLQGGQIDLDQSSVRFHDPGGWNGWSFDSTASYRIFEELWTNPGSDHGGVVAQPFNSDNNYASAQASISGLPSTVSYGETLELTLSLTNNGQDPCSSRYSWAQGIFVRLTGAEFISALNGGFDSYQAYDESANKIALQGAKILEFYSDFTLGPGSTLIAFATIRALGNIRVDYRGWATDEDDITKCSIHLRWVDDDRPSTLTINTAELCISRDPTDVINDRIDFLTYPTNLAQSSMQGLHESSISIDVNPNSLYLGGGTTISGFISSSVTGDLSGTVYLQYSTDDVNWNLIESTATSSSGAYLYWWTPSSTGNFYLCSYWNGNSDYAGATSDSVTLTVTSPSGGNLVDHSMCKGVQGSAPNIYPVSRTNTFYTDDEGAYSWVQFSNIYGAGHLIHWDCYDPDGSVFGYLTWHIPDPGAGNYYPLYGAFFEVYIIDFQSWFADRVGRPFQTEVYYDGSLVVTETWTVLKHSSSISIYLSSSTIDYGQSVTISSQLSPSSSDGTTTLQYSTDGSIWNDIVSGTPSNGYYSSIWTPQSVGAYYIHAMWNGNLCYYGSTSSVQGLTVERETTLLATALSSPSITYGNTVIITATLSPPINGKIVTIQFSLDGSAWFYLNSGTTNSTGEYSCEWSPDVGRYYLRSSWTGDQNYQGSTSPSVTLTAIHGTVYIRADGSIYPSIAPIQRDGDVYALTGDIWGTIMVERSNSVIEGNRYTVQGSAREGGIRLYNVADITVRNIIIRDCGKAIHLEGSSHNVISSNSIFSCDYGIFLRYSSFNSVFKNYLTGNFAWCIRLIDSSYNTISQNNVTNNGGAYGISLDESQYNTISENIVLGNGFGVAVNVQSENNLIYGNNVTANGVGFDFYHSASSTIYHNILANNGVQVWNAYALINLWDDDYPSGGNYWSDYIGIDVNRDGIGDTPYTIDVNNQDNYPLMRPWPSHDIAAAGLSLSKTIIGSGYSVTINANIANQGDFSENINIAVYANNMLIGSQVYSSTQRGFATITFIWDTTSFTMDQYTIRADVSPVTGETDTADNTFIYGIIVVTIPGDVNGDKEVNNPDLTDLSTAYSSGTSGSHWNPNCDINSNNLTDVFDLFILGKNYGSSIQKGPVGYWKFDEGSGNVACDSSGNHNDGTINSASWTTGIYNGALQFDGVNDYVGIPSSPSLTLTGNQISLELWIKPSITLDSTLASRINIMDKGDGYGLQMEANDARINFFVNIGYADQWLSSTTSTWIAGTWYHIAGTYNGTSESIYVNGVLENTKPLSGALSGIGLPLSIGSYCFGTMNFFNGTIDEVKIYDYARTAEEIWNDYLSAMPSPRVLAWGWSLHVAGGIDREWTFLNGTTFTFRSWLQSKGYSVLTESEAFPDGVVTLARLQKFSAILLYANILGQPGNNIYNDIITDYVNQGGGLIIPTNFADPAITIDHAFGFDWIDDPWSYLVDAVITDPTHPIMKGITELPKAAGCFVDWDALINDAPLPSGTAVLARSIDNPPKIALMAFQYGAGKVVVGPADGLMRPYGPTNMDWWDVIAEPAIENRLLLNAIDYVVSTP